MNTGFLNSAEHVDVMSMFEKEFKHERLDKEPRSIWTKGNIYQSGITNNLFLAYRRGYALGKVNRIVRELWKRQRRTA